MLADGLDTGWLTTGLSLVSILALAVALGSGRWPAARIFASFTAFVLLTGLIDFGTAMSRITSPAIIAVTALVIISAALSKLPGISTVLFGRKKRGPKLTLIRFLGSAALASAVTPNTAVVGALMGPASRRPDMPAHRLLLPLSYMSLAGGMLTPFGTSASLMVTGEAAARGVNLNVLDFLLPGLCVVVLVYLTLILVSPLLLTPREKKDEAEDEIFYVEARIDEGSPLIGRSVAKNQLRHLDSFFLAELIRGDRVITPVSPVQHIQQGDRLIFVGNINHIDELRGIKGLTIEGSPRSDAPGEIYHAVIAINSVMDGKTLSEIDFRARFDASVLAVRRGDERLSGKLGDIRLRSGDVLILAAGPDFRSRENLRANLHILDVDNPNPVTLPTRDSWLLLGAFGVFLALALTQIIPFSATALGLAALVIGMNWVSPREARRIFPFDLVIILWGAILLSLLVQQSGLAGLAAGAIADLTLGLPPFVALAAIFFFAWVMTELFSNASAALTAFPVAMDTALRLDQAPEAFILATAFGASASFLLPFGYQTHLMVMTPGRYRLTDYLRLGAVVFTAYAVGALIALTLIHL